MIAIPLKGNLQSSSITTVFGKAKYIALVNELDGSFEIKDVDFGSGKLLAAWLSDIGATKVVVQEIGANPFMSLNQNNIKVYFYDQKKASVDEITAKLTAGELQEVTLQNFNELFGKANDEANNHEHANAKHSGCCGHSH
jgi:predicted Fe-Mo cluster-binding NifX family protein